jgi:hypothetical protein
VFKFLPDGLGQLGSFVAERFERLRHSDEAPARDHNRRPTLLYSVQYIVQGILRVQKSLRTLERATIRTLRTVLRTVRTRVLFQSTRRRNPQIGISILQYCILLVCQPGTSATGKYNVVCVPGCKLGIMNHDTRLVHATSNDRTIVLESRVFWFVQGLVKMWSRSLWCGGSVALVSLLNVL